VRNCIAVLAVNVELATKVAAIRVAMNATASAPMNIKNQRDCTAVARIFATGESVLVEMVADDPYWGLSATMAAEVCL
jgi:hypothetical protein